jgi:membrane fusion protein, multidrug efflux system
MTKNTSLKNLRKWILFFLGIIILFVSFKLSQTIANSNEIRSPEGKSLVKEVYTLEVKKRSYQVEIPSSGVLEAYRRVSLTSRVQGVMQTIKPLFKTGQKYKAGQTLVQIDASDYRANVKAQRASLYNLITSVLPDLQLDFEGAYEQWSQFLKNFDIEKPTPSLPKMEEKVRLFVSGRGLISSYYALQNLEKNLQYYSLKAPFDGVLVSANMTEGSLVRPGQQMGEFIATDQYELKVSLPKTFIQKIEEGAKVSLKSIDTNQTYEGTVARINAKVNTQTQSVEVFIRVSDPDLKEGMFLEANISANTFEQVFAVDRGLLNGDQELFIVENNTLQLRKVEAIHFTETLAIVKGLENGAVIIAQPLIGAYSGMEVISIVLPIEK